VRLGVLSPDPDDLIGSISLRYSPKENLDLETNLLHAFIGLYNLSGKYRFYESKEKQRAVSIKAGVKWFAPKYSLILPKAVSDVFAEANILILPIEVTASQTVFKRIQVNVGLGYSHSVVLPGSVYSASVKGGFGSREAYARADVNYFLGQNFVVFFGAHQPLYQGIFTDAAIETEVAPGISVGTQTSEWVEGEKRSLFFGGFEALFLYTHFRMTVGYPMKLFTEYAPSPFASFELFWRF